MAALWRAAADADLCRRAYAVEEAVSVELRAAGADRRHRPERPVAFFCAEFGVHALAPDLRRRARRARRRPAQGGLRPRPCRWSASGCSTARATSTSGSTPSGWQHEYWIDADRERLPAALVTDATATPLASRCRSAGATWSRQIWRVDVGRVPLYLLDTDRPENDRRSTAGSRRGSTSATAHVRLAQYALLGIGGVRALRALGIDPGRRAPERGPCRRSRRSSSPRAAVAARPSARRGARGGAPAHSSSPPTRRCRPATRRTRRTRSCGPRRPAPTRWASTATRSSGWARVHPDDARRAARHHAARRCASSRAANGVSRRHGEVARRCGSRSVGATCRSSRCRSPTSPTASTSPPGWRRRCATLLDRHLGADWLARARRSRRPGTASTHIPDEELWAVRCALRAELVDVRPRARDARPAGARRGARVRRGRRRALRPRRLTIGFARRLATYKRLYLLVRDPSARSRLLGGDRARSRSSSPARPIPHDDDAKRVVAGLFAAKRGARRSASGSPSSRTTTWQIAPPLVAGVRRVAQPAAAAAGGERHQRHEGRRSTAACNLSVLDGWWDEAYDGSNGWGIASEAGGDADARTSATPTRSTPDRARNRAALLRARRQRHSARAGCGWSRRRSRAPGCASERNACSPTTSSGSTGPACADRRDGSCAIVPPR